MNFRQETKLRHAVLMLAAIFLGEFVAVGIADAGILISSADLLVRARDNISEVSLAAGVPNFLEVAAVDPRTGVGFQTARAAAILHAPGAGTARFGSMHSLQSGVNVGGQLTQHFTLDAPAELFVRVANRSLTEGAFLYGGGTVVGLNSATWNVPANSDGIRTFSLTPHQAYQLSIDAGGLLGTAIGFIFPDEEYDTIIEWGIDGLAGDTADNPILPTLLDLDSNFFEFDSITSTDVRFYDPAIAIGYDYETEDVPFASVLIPDILPGGDSEFELLVGSDSYALRAGQEFDFTAFYTGGVRDFSIRGIDTGEGLNPNDPTAFVTGLSFTQGDQLSSFRMSAVTTTVNTVPEPGSLMIFTIGLPGFLLLRRRNRISAGRGSRIETA